MKKVLLLILLTTPAFAISCEVDDLKRLVISLNQHVANLEKRVKELESNMKSKPANVSNEKASWRKLQRGMSFSQVRGILGEPKTIKAGRMTFWYYSSSLSSSKITFWDDRVDSWDEPN